MISKDHIGIYNKHFKLELRTAHLSPSYPLVVPVCPTEVYIVPTI